MSGVRERVSGAHEWLRISVPISRCSRIIVQDSFYRGLCLRATSKDAEIWFADYGNVAHVAKTDLRNIPKEFLEKPAVSLLGRLNLIRHKAPSGDLENWILEDFNRKILMVRELRDACGSFIFQ